MGLKKWIVHRGGRETALEMAEELGINKFLALLAVHRGFEDPFELESFLSDDYDPEDPFALTDMDRAAERVLSAIENHEKITVYGDYDCDGVTATAILYSYLKKRGALVDYYIPDRIAEGYGMNEAAVRRIHERGTNLIITVDNGVNAVKEIELAYSLGMEVVVTDHHLPQGVLPMAGAVVDPHRKDDYSDAWVLCGAGVAFKLITALEGDADPKALLLEYGALLALGTVGDIVPLRLENRAIVKRGLRCIADTPSLGLKALKDAAGITGTFSATQLSFQLVPRINAAGRMGDAARAVELLLANSPKTATTLAEELNRENAERQAVGDRIFKEAVEKIDREKLFEDDIIVVSGDRWHSGVVGIVAAKITEQYGKPSILLSGEGELLHGSGRSVEGFNLFLALQAASEETVTFGGHEQAAGVTIKKERLPAFRRLLNDYAKTVPEFVPKLSIDCELAPGKVTVELYDVIELLAPFGAENPVPVFLLSNMKITAVSPLKDGRFCKITVSGGGKNYTVLQFSEKYCDFPFAVGDFVDIAFELLANEYRGNRTLSLRAVGMRPAKFDEDAYFSSLLEYRRFQMGKISENTVSALLPDRKEFIAVFTFLRRRPEATFFQIHFANTALGAGKISVILKALCSLHLIEAVLKDGVTRYSIIPNAAKAELSSAEIIKRLNACKNADGKS